VNALYNGICSERTDGRGMQKRINKKKEKFRKGFNAAQCDRLAKTEMKGTRQSAVRENVSESTNCRRGDERRSTLIYEIL